MRFQKSKFKLAKQDNTETNQDIENCPRVYILAVIDNCISHLGPFELKSIFASEEGIFSCK